MQFSFSEEQEEFRSMLRRFLEAKSPPSAVRAQMVTDQGYDPDVWASLAGELGVTALHIPEEYGGAGFGVSELAIAAEEMGRALLCAPFFASTVMAATAIINAGSDNQKRTLLPDLASGDVIATLAAAEPGGGWAPDQIKMTAAKSGDGYTLTGAKSYVLDGMNGGRIVVAANAPGGGIAFFTAAADGQGVSRTALKSMDPTRKLARIDFDAAPVELLGDAAAGAEAYAKTMDVMLTCLANEMNGGAERLREDALEYVSMRMQFGRTIASFQTTKHKAADMLLDVELSKAAGYSAASALDDQDPDARAVASLAKAAASEAYFQTAVHAVQMHGGIGFTFDNDTHLWFKRAKQSEAFLGDANLHRERMMQHWGTEA
jgi:alkylation response protein AidB-like acyl-CoA dehydrogenase